MKTNVQNINHPHDKVTYFKNGEVKIDLDNILAPNKILQIGNLLLKVEGSHIDVVKLLGVTNTDQMVYLEIEEMKTGSVHKISTRIDQEAGKYFVWWVVNFDHVLGAIEDRVVDQLKGSELWEFDY